MHGKRVNIVHTEIVKDGFFIYKERLIKEPEDAAKMMEPYYRGADREKLYVVCLDKKGEPVSLELAAMGTADRTIAGMKEIYKNAILVNACGIIVFHNHTSGEARPSSDDISITWRMEQSGNILGIKLLDHIIIGDKGEFYSFCKEGRLKTKSDVYVLRD